MAKKFRFALQPVLDHRKRIEDEKQQVLALRRRAYEEAKGLLEALNDEFRANALALREGHKNFTAEDLRAHYAHLQYLDRTIDVQIRVVAERAADVERARRDVVAASKDRKVVDKLKERRRTAYVVEELRVEQIELDDGNARRYSRTVREANLEIS